MFNIVVTLKYLEESVTEDRTEEDVVFWTYPSEDVDTNEDEVIAEDEEVVVKLATAGIEDEMMLEERIDEE